MAKKNVVCTHIAEVREGAGFAPGSLPTLASELKAGIYTIQVMDMQLVFVPHEIKTDSLIRVADSKANEVLAEIDKFWTLKAKFDEFGFLHKRGFLLHGAPGMGKTTTLNIVMADTVAAGGVVVMCPSDIGTLTTMLRRLREVEPSRRVVVIMEDLDSILRDDETGLLALLDGDRSIDNVVFVATTNYLRDIPERIHARPSRFDKKIEITGPTAEERRVYLKSRNVPEEKLEKWVKYSNGLSMAHLKELIISVLIFGNELAREAKRLAGKNFVDPEPDVDNFDNGLTLTMPSVWGSLTGKGT